MTLMVKLIKAENEENALICIKVMIDGFRAHKVRLVKYKEDRRLM
jgi:transformation/transcription domain-associated protein